MCYSKNPREGYLGRKNLMRLRSSFANEIFRDELYHIYEQKYEVRDKLKNYFDDRIKKSMSMEETVNADNKETEKRDNTKELFSEIKLKIHFYSL